jgi:hypothetical protein
VEVNALILVNLPNQTVPPAVIHPLVLPAALDTILVELYALILV